MAILILFGGVCASFIYALTSAESSSFLLRRSRCDSCMRPLKWYELFPVLSFLILKGRCLICKTKIPVSNLVVEVLMIILFICPIFIELSLKDLTLYYLIILFLIPLSIFDFLSFIISIHINLIFLFTCFFIIFFYLFDIMFVFILFFLI